MKNELSRIRLFIGNVWMILAVDPLRKVIFSFSCAVFSLFAAEVMRNVFSRVLIDLETDIWSMTAAGARTCRKTLSPRNWTE